MHNAKPLEDIKKNHYFSDVGTQTSTNLDVKCCDFER